MSTSLTAMSRAQKAAAVMLAVGPERAASVMRYLGEEEAEQLTVEIATLGDIPSKQLEDLLTEFQAEALVHQQLISGGEQHARDVMRRMHGEQADEIVDRLLATTHSSPFQFLRMHDITEVLQHLRDEHPQTIALVLAHLPARMGAQILAGLDRSVQAVVANRLATLERATPEVVEHVEAALKERLGEVRRRSGRRDGVKELADMLNQTDPATERAILAELEEIDAVLAERVRALMFMFEDLVILDNRSLQEVLRQIDPARLALAMKGVSPELREALENNLSERARTVIAEEMDLMGPVRVSEVEEAQSEVIQVVHDLEQEGLIQINRSQEELVE